MTTSADESASEGETIAFLGTGWSFPPSFSANGAELEMVAGVDDIHQSLQILLGTALGERVMHEDYGCNLDSIVFEEADQAMVNKISSMVSDAIVDYEPRIELLELEVSQTEDAPELIQIRLEYHVPETNSRFNMVYPFYLNEATQPIS